MCGIFSGCGILCVRSVCEVRCEIAAEKTKLFPNLLQSRLRFGSGAEGTQSEMENFCGYGSAAQCWPSLGRGRVANDLQSRTDISFRCLFFSPPFAQREHQGHTADMAAAAWAECEREAVDLV